MTEPRIEGEENQKKFIALFGAILRMRNLLLSFDDFKGKELISERDLQDYLGRYQDLRDEWVNRTKGEKEDITDDIVFEIELIRQIEINIDYSKAFMQCETKAIELGNICNLSQLNENLQENCIPLSVKNMDASSYEEFLTERRKLMASMMKRYYWSL